MSNKNTGKDFEVLVAKMHESFLKDIPGAVLTRDVLIEGPDGKRQIDVMIEYTIGLYQAKLIIECKDYERKVGVAKVDEFHSKLMDIEGNTGVIVSSKGFSASAINKARRLNISLCTAHQAGTGKWKIDLPIPVMLVVHKVTGLSSTVQIKGDSKKDNKQIVFTKSQLTTWNGVGVHEWIQTLWNTQAATPDDLINLYLGSRDESFTFNEHTTATYKHSIDKEPVWFMDNEGAKHELSTLEIKLNVKRLYLSGYLNDIKGARVLMDLTNSKGTIFLSENAFTDSIKDLKQYNSATEVPDANYICSFAYTPIANIAPLVD